MSLSAAIDLLACPRCAGPLTVAGSVSCPSGHSFDVARQGYVNLSGRSAPRNADRAEMVAARVAFLAAGHYDPIVASLLALTPAGARTVLDAGGGTGFYAARLLDARPAARGLALDVSVPAIRRAARAHDRLAAAVADVWQALPVRDGAFDVLLSVFAPRNPAEFTRALTETGTLITVTPAPAHLAELRNDLDLLDHQSDKAHRLANSLAGHFRADGHLLVSRTQLWESATARASVLMGPNAFHLTPAGLDDRLARLDWPRPVTVAVRVDRWCSTQLNANGAAAPDAADRH